MLIFKMIKKIIPLDFQWPTQEPFLFCVHHLDRYPKGNKDLTVSTQHLTHRNIGQDFVEKDGFRMYHGDGVPGFPVHPHRGFETITIVRRGYVDHADSLGAAGRYGEGDVQWMTAGKGVQHSEMFPLLHQDQENTVELFQIWLNLPKINKMSEPYFKMFWKEQIPEITIDEGKAKIQIIAGEFAEVSAIEPPPNSWASKKDCVTIYLVKINKAGKVNFKAVPTNVNRSLYFFSGENLACTSGEKKQIIGERSCIELESTADIIIENNSNSEIELLFLQAQIINEPVTQYGPFVMNTREEIIKAFDDYQKTQFGGWPWPRPDMVHGSKIERFAKYPDGRIEKP